ncbi:CoA-binding protein [Acuticoccus sediminis]|uniref:CoA-binding protein n=1 Tax=Acuticoccus sediminis TaxID=2184697 RepID=A0A8B2NLP7_9HYPH|nr:acetate--CoA ligase family protein [Acuticoccus sediminis]RAH99025.1 CoA-binding protein [Acuticoccus sediminis]
MSLAPFLSPESVAIVGASDNPDKIGGRPIRYLREFGFKGDVFPINPGRDTVQGLKAYASLADLPKVPDAVIIAVAGTGVVDTVNTCAALGVKAAIVMASGFGETGPEGKRIEAEMRETAHKAGMRIVGPNSQGLANFGTGAVLSFSTMFIEAQPEDGPVACISQSGAMSVVPYGMLRARGIGVRHCHATGNDSDVNVAELAAEVVQDPDVKLLLLYLESLPDPAALARTAAIAKERDVPIIAVKSGRTAAGSRAAQSHTGAIATEDRIVDAFFAKNGIWRAKGMRDLVRAAELYLKGWKPVGRRLAVISNSGATCVLAVDAAEHAGLEMAEFPPAIEDELRSILPGFASPRNPVDITAALLTDSGLFSRVLPAAGRDTSVDMFLVGIPVSGKGYDFPRFAADTGAFLKDGGKPVVLAAPQASVREAFAREGVPVFETEDDAVEAMTQFVNHRALMARSRPGAPAAARPPAPLEGLDENRSLQLIAAAGVTVARHRLCTTLDAARSFLEDAPGKIVLKACSAAIPHKSEHGLVRLNIDSEEALASAYADLVAGVERLGQPFEGLLACDQVKGERELVIGGYHDPVFGPAVVIGDGGITVEAMPDNVLLLSPFDEAEVMDALQTLRIAPLFRGVRGQPPLDAGAVARAAIAVGKLLCDETADVRSVDVNPLIVSASGAIAVDALVEVAATATARAAAQ